MSGLIGPSAFIFGAISRDMTNRAKVSGRPVQRNSAPTARCVAFEVPAVVRQSEGGAVLRGPPNVQVPPARLLSGLWATCGRRGWGGGLELSVSSVAGASDGLTRHCRVACRVGRHSHVLLPASATSEPGLHSPGACVLGDGRRFCNAGSHSEGGGVPWLLGLSRADYLIQWPFVSRV